MWIKWFRRSNGTGTGPHEDTDRGSEIGRLAATDDGKLGARCQRPSFPASERDAGLTLKSAGPHYIYKVAPTIQSVNLSHSLLSPAVTESKLTDGSAARWKLPQEEQSKSTFHVCL